MLKRLLQLLLDLIDAILGKPSKPKPPQPPQQPPTPPPPSSVSELLLQRHNDERSKRGTQPLKIDARLNAAAQKHADWMHRTNILSHTGEGGTTVGARIRHEAYNYSAAGENIAIGYISVNAVMQGWLDSPGHRDNILSPAYQRSCQSDFPCLSWQA